VSFPNISNLTQFERLYFQLLRCKAALHPGYETRTTDSCKSTARLTFDRAGPKVGTQFWL